jgi:sulfonate transport system ATP-binding protein
MFMSEIDGAALTLRQGPESALTVPPTPPLRADRSGSGSRGFQPGLAIRLRGLRKAYGERVVLDDINLDIAPGEFVAIVGRSGCGKSTLLRLVAGLETAQAGQLQLDVLHGSGAAAPSQRAAGTAKPASARPGGSDPQETRGPSSQAQDAHRGDVRIMFQDARLLPWKRVLDNIALGLDGADAKARAMLALQQVGLADRAHEWPAVLSGGQRQRVALARALVHRPRLLLLDEPLGALDALTRIEMQALIERLWREHGFTAVLVTHDVAEAVALADRVLLIEDHRVALDDRIALPRPRSRGSAAFAALEERVLNRVLQQPTDPAAAAVQDRHAGPSPATSWRFAL